MFSRVEQIGRDLRYAARQLYQAPAFTATVLLTLAVAIAANTALFSVARAVLLRPLPYRDPNRLVSLWHGDAGSYPWYTFSYPRYRYFERQLGAQATLAAYDDEVVTASINGQPLRLEGGRVSATFFPLLGVKPAMGRFFSPDEDRHHASATAVIGHRFWQQRYRGDRAVIGRAITIDNEVFTIIGVLPAKFEFLGAPIDVWRSRMVDTRTFAPTSVQLGATYLTVVGRLRPGVSFEQFQAALRVAQNGYTQDNPGNSDIDGPVTTAPLQDKIFGSVHTTLFLLWGAVVCLLFIAFANVANLVFARALTKQTEISVRMALGASGTRLAQQLITENVFLSLCSLVLSWPLTQVGMKTLVDIFQHLSPAIPDIQPDFSLALFTVAVTTLLGAVMGAVPLPLLLKEKNGSAMRSQDRSFTVSRRSARLRHGIVAFQIMLSMVLLAATGLLGKSLLQLHTLSSGLRTEQVDVFPLDLAPERYASWPHRVSFYDDVLRRVQSIPGMRDVAIADRVDLIGSSLGYQIQMEGAPDLGSRNPGARGRSVSPNYFKILGIPLLRGRVFDNHDTSSSQGAVIINEAFARKFFPGEDPIGKHITYSTDRIYCQVVGVVGDVRSGVQDPGVEEQIYLPLSQRPWLVAKLLLRTSVQTGVAKIVREQIRQADPDQAVADLTSFQQIVAGRLEAPRTTAAIVAFFGLSALLLVAIGVYGVIAYSVTQRRREIGIRIALGADASRVRALVFRQTFNMLVAGLACGLPGSFLVSRLYANLLFATTPNDPLVVTASGGLLLSVALLATYLPAHKAMRFDPASILRA